MSADVTPGGRRRKHRRVVRPGPEASDAAGADALRQHPPTLPQRATEDTDAAWGGGEDSNDARLRRDVPPHW